MSCSTTLLLWVGSLCKEGTHGISFVASILSWQGQCCSIVRTQSRRAWCYKWLTDCYEVWQFPSLWLSSQNNHIELVVLLTGIGQVLYLPGRHIPIDTSLCSQSPQVRIYGFVAAGITPSRANEEDETHKTWKQQVILPSESVNSTHSTYNPSQWAFKQMCHNTVFIKNQS